MVLYFFPPLGGVAMSRNVRNVEHLPRYGWTPIVLTPRNPAYHLRDPGGVDLVPSRTDVARTASLEAGHLRPVAVRVRAALGGLGRLVRRSGRPVAFSAEGSGSPTLTERAGDSLGGGRLERIRRVIFFPDDQVGWLPFAVAGAIR